MSKCKYCGEKHNIGQVIIPSCIGALIRGALGDLKPSEGHTELQELCGLVRVLRSQRDSEEKIGIAYKDVLNQVANLTGVPGKPNESVLDGVKRVVSERDRMGVALSRLLAACEQADACEELCEKVDGSLLDSARLALSGTGFAPRPDATE